MISEKCWKIAGIAILFVEELYVETIWDVVSEDRMVMSNVEWMVVQH